MGCSPGGGWGSIDLVLLAEILHQIAEHPPQLGVSLHLGGEPLLHPQIGRAVALVHEYLGVAPMLASNGVLLDEEAVRSLVAGGGAELEIDFSADPAVFQRFRGSDRWAAVRTNIRRALDADLAVCIRSYDVDQLPLRRMFGNPGNLSLAPFRLHNVGGEFATSVARKFNLANRGGRTTPCSHLWFGMAITWQGHVVLCCRDVMHRHVIGRLTGQTIREVWQGDELNAIRRLHVRGRLDNLPLCRTCDRPRDELNRPWSIVQQYSPLNRLLPALTAGLRKGDRNCRRAIRYFDAVAVPDLPVDVS